jgi:hypothetical protein
MAVGYVPFEQEHIDLLLGCSVDEDGAFSMRRFSTDAFGALNPLLTFRCLSNMPAYHVSVSFDLQGPYFVTYPSAGQLYVALEEAVAALSARLVDVALVAGVAHQRNFLVEHHHARLDPPVPAASLRDVAACLVLERASHAGGRARARLRSIEVSYVVHHPFEERLVPAETVDDERASEREVGPAALPLLVCESLGRVIRHRIESRDGIRASSVWGPP